MFSGMQQSHADGSDSSSSSRRDAGQSAASAKPWNLLDQSPVLEKHCKVAVLWYCYDRLMLLMVMLHHTA